MEMEQTTELLRGRVFTLKRFQAVQKEQYHALAAANAEASMLQLIKLETKGGVCPRCQRPWKQIGVKNVCADYVYYDPDCECYPRCHFCGTSFHREWAMGARDFGRCKSCGFSTTPVYGRKCSKCAHWFVADNPAWGPGVRCEDCRRKRKRAAEADKIDIAELARSVQEAPEEESVPIY